MYFSFAFFSTLVLPIFAIPSHQIDVTKYAGETNGGYIVMFKSNNATHSFANKNKMVTYCYEIISACAGKFTNQCIQELQANPDVEGIYEDGLGGVNAASEGPEAIHGLIVNISTIRTNATWGLARLSSKAKLEYTNVTATNFTFHYDSKAGQGSDIYVLDSGVYLDHTDFDGRARWGATVVGKPGVDDNGHGTFCAGAAAGTTYGVAKKANIIAVKVLDSAGRSSTSNAIAGLDYVYKSAQASGRPSVISCSLTWNAHQLLDDVIEKVAAGNFGKNASLYSPGRTPSAITIAASNIVDQQIAMSDYGVAVFMFAPGRNIISTYIGNKDMSQKLPRQLQLNQEHLQYKLVINVQSAAYVAGIVATFQEYGKMSINQMKYNLDDVSLKNILAEGTKDEVNENGVKLVAYKNKYYTHDSDSEVLFALAEESLETMCVVDLVINNNVPGHGSTKEVCMCKIKVLVSKETLEQPVLKALDKDCLVTWVGANGHNA
ncbi:hypothetical protein C0995_000274 [Termitomyces sp. Mi166|nr:hypothetical protein C0995_000274 [Termitomyces sp. Mi166\